MQESDIAQLIVNTNDANQLAIVRYLCNSNTTHLNVERILDRLIFVCNEATTIDKV